MHILISFLILALSIVAAPVVGVGTAMGLHHLGGMLGRDAQVRKVCELDDQRASIFENNMGAINKIDGLCFEDFREKGGYTTKSKIIMDVSEARNNLTRRKI